MKVTMTERLLEWWKNEGRVCRFSDLEGAYMALSLRHRGWKPNPDYVPMTVSRILHKNGVKAGDPGTTAPWVLRTR